MFVLVPVSNSSFYNLVILEFQCVKARSSMDCELSSLELLGIFNSVADWLTSELLESKLFGDRDFSGIFVKGMASVSCVRIWMCRI